MTNLSKRTSILLLLAGLATLVFFWYSFPIEENTEPNEPSYEVIEVLEASCEVDTDCPVPMDYAVRSSCPFESLCLENKCTVVCPHPFTGTKNPEREQ